MSGGIAYVQSSALLLPHDLAEEGESAIPRFLRPSRIELRTRYAARADGGFVRESVMSEVSMEASVDAGAA